MGASPAKHPLAVRFVVGRFLGEIPVTGRALQRALPALDARERELVRTCVSLCAYEIALKREVERGLQTQQRALAAFAAALAEAEAAEAAAPLAPQESPPVEPPRAA